MCAAYDVIPQHMISYNVIYIIINGISEVNIYYEITTMPSNGSNSRTIEGNGQVLDCKP